MRALLVASVAAVGLLQAVPDAKAIKLSAPALVGSIDTGKLKGDPTQLAWSPQGDKLFIRTSDRDGTGMTTKHHYYVTGASEIKPEPVDSAPAWATDYIAWKSGQSAPGNAAWGIDVKDEEKTVTGTEAPMGGSLAGGAIAAGQTGTSVEDVGKRAQQMQRARVVTLLLGSDTIGEFMNTQFIPGYTFGWAPHETGLIVYGNSGGRLVVMDPKGGKQEVASTRSVLLPGWSPDGSTIAFMQRTAKKKYDIYTIQVQK